MTKVLLLACTVAAALTACNKPAPTAKADPLGSFKALADRCAAAFGPSDKTTPGPKGPYRVIHDQPASAFDVRKTDSLVSPFTAYIEVKVRSTEDVAQKTVLITDHTYRLDYALQGDAWRLKSVQWAFHMPVVNAGKGLQPWKFESVLEDTPEAVVCDPSRPA